MFGYTNTKDDLVQIIKDRLFDDLGLDTNDLLEIENILIDNNVSLETFVENIDVTTSEIYELIDSALGYLDLPYDYIVERNGTVKISLKSIYENVQSELEQDSEETDEEYKERIVEEYKARLEEYEDYLSNYFSVGYCDVTIDKVETIDLTSI